MFWQMPSTRTTFDPICTFRLNAQIKEIIEVDGELYHSQAICRASQSRDWLESINSGGCTETRGTALVFRLRSDAIVLVPNGLCRSAERVLRAEGQSDVVADCNGVPIPDGDIFAVDNGMTPKLWKLLSWGDEVQLISMRAERSFASPGDLLDQRAPGLLDAGFEENGNWSRSPEWVIPFRRRYDEAEPYRFEVQLGNFELF